ncbi:alpha-L-fucosidase [Streptomyces cocklensis]|uniref:alpha-L-fucosidase n=1 Tax=Actinacidiphila cocklensis TaxID=887465 RepID=A0A9W4DUT4_9ACTN|nr:alpha-L-fucosidase [Actinacidiphila cocklensis]MDD1059949.1 alpha-L-fucosidase [Actinacidiphila cocklensis]WSX72806.1 alpha-L-fucosidase [Streptomyces sp. NBC_00899]WSX81126.1 alpha-L-fucosidase [Streptomyces sp. NBC_00899]CAG6395907.1 Alpha-L-fucosidase [Actinacidiphila cocklensis]
MSSSSAPISRRSLLAAAGAATAFGLLRFAPDAAATDGPGSYSASWSSVDQHPPAPAWFQDAKFGIYYHWGVFSVPAFGNEWYPRNMYIGGSAENQHHIATYGDPSSWPYNNFIDGARDKAGNFVQFAPKLASQGGNWDPAAWAQLFKAAGARFAGPVAEHHDGFSMWNSSSNPWNSVQHGPKLDLVAQHAQAIRGQGLKFMASLHHAYHFNGYYDHVPNQSDPTLRILFGQQGSAAENQLWYNKLIEVIDGYQPDLIWQDFDLGLVQESYRLQFLAYYYNKAVAWNRDVAATYKDGLDNKGEVFDFERGGPAGLLTPYWLTDDSISSSSWCYTAGIGYYTTQALLHALIDRTAKGGTMLLNIAPMADGTIPSGQQTVLRGMGDWLGRFGEAIYGTRSWSSYGEGPTAMGGGSFSGPKAGVAKDVRFTRSQDNTVLYATSLGWQGGTMTVTSLNSNQFNISSLTSAQLLDNSAGSYISLPTPTQDGSGLHLAMPSSNAPFNALAYTVKLTFSGQIPALGGGGTGTGYVKIANVTSGLVLDSGGNVASGSNLKQWNYDGSSNLQWQLVDLGNGYYRIVNRTNGMVADSWGNTANGAPARQTTWNGGNNQQWSLTSVGNSRYQIVNRGTGTALDGSGSTTAGSTAVMWAPNSSTNNQWTISGV